MWTGFFSQAWWWSRRRVKESRTQCSILHLYLIIFMYMGIQQLCWRPKLWSETNRIKGSLDILSTKSSESNLIFLTVFYLIIWVMEALKNLGKIFILKTWELISLGALQQEKWGITITCLNMQNIIKSLVKDFHVILIVYSKAKICHHSIKLTIA